MKMNNMITVTNHPLYHQSSVTKALLSNIKLGVFGGCIFQVFVTAQLNLN